MQKLPPESWKQLFALFDEALALPPAQLEAWLSALDGERGRLVPQLRELLADRARGAGQELLQGLPRFTQVAETGAPVSSGGAPQAGERVGPYRLVRELGQGGMAAVWLAERADGAYERSVAVKLPHASWAGGLAARMAREAHILAALEHPHIARLYDAGVDQRGRPFMALEYVEGQAIDVYCRQNGLSVARCLALVLEVIRGVSYAHARLVVHRDLKPGNVLVGADGSVRLLDFGIAKLLEGDGEDATRLTGLAGRAFTPEYASPEQILGDAIGTASDVYSLGVMTYELLTGTLPYRLERNSPAALQEAIAAVEPRPASEAAADEARRRELRGDLDAILNRALKKNPAERYPTADALAQDLERHLAGEPVLARPDSRLYRLRKFAARHRLALAAGAAVAGLLVAATGLSLRQAHLAAQERNRALRLLARNRAMNEFVGVMLTEVASPDRPITVDELLERSESLVFSADTPNPEHQAVILQMLSSYYGALGNRGKTEALLARALRLARDSADPLLVGTLECQHAYADSELGHVDAARSTIAAVLARSRGLPEVAAVCLRARAALARDTNDAQGALAYGLQAQAELRRSEGVDPTFEAGLLGDLGYAHFLVGRAEQAERLFAESAQRFAAVGRPEHPEAVAICSNWATSRFATGDVLGALALEDRALGVAAQHAAGGEPPLSLIADRALSLDALARYDEALAGFDAVLAIAQRRQDRAAAAFALVGKAKVRLGQGDPERAQRELDQALAAESGVSPSDSPVSMNAAVVRARIAAARGQLAEAEAAFSSILGFWDSRKIVTGATWSALRDRGDVRLRQGRLDDALADARRSEEIARSVQGGKPFSSLTGLSLSLIARIQAAAGRSQEARRAALAALAQLTPALGDQHPETRRARELAAP